MSEAAEVPSSLPPSFRAEPESPAEIDFLRFDHPVRELPGLLAALERTAAAEPDERQEKAVEKEAPGSRARRVRRRALLGLAATGAVFLILQLSGFLPGVFSLHMPLLVFVAVLVVGGTVQYVQLYHLVVAESTGSVQVPLGDRGDGEVRWTYQAHGGINDMLVEDLNGNGTGEVILATPTGQVIVLDAEGGEQWRADLGGEPARTLEVIEWDGNLESLEVAAGSGEGKVVVLDAQGQFLEEWDDWGSPITDLVLADLDHDGRGDLVAGLGSPHFQVFRHGLPNLTVSLPEPPQKLGALDDLFVVGSGNRVQAYRLIENSWIEQYRPLFGSLIFTLVVIAVGLPVILLHPRLEIGSRRAKAR